MQLAHTVAQGPDFAPTFCKNPCREEEHPGSGVDAARPGYGARPRWAASSPADCGLASERSAEAISASVTLSGWWQAARWPSAYSVSGGSTVLQTSVARGQRGWNTQPEGGSIGFGGSPVTSSRLRARFSRGSGIGIAPEQRLGVGVDRLGVERLGGRDLHQLAQVHDRDPVGDVADHAEVVGHEQVGQLELVLQVVEQVHDLRLDRDVERGHRLVQHDHPRLERQSARDADALALAAGELVREPARVLGREARRARAARRPCPRPPHASCRAAAAARTPAGARSCAGSARRTGPGRPSACRGAAAAAPCGRRW